MLFRISTTLILSLLVTSAQLAPVPSSVLPTSATTSVVARDDAIANGVLTAGDIVEAIAQGLGIDSKAGSIVQAVADGLTAGGTAAGGKKAA